MNKKKFRKLLVVVMSLFFGMNIGGINIQAQDNATPKNEEKQEQEKAATSEFTINGITLTLPQAIEMVVRNSPVLQSARYDVLMSDSSYNQYMKKFGLNLSAGFNYNKTKFEMESENGNDIWTWSVDAALTKMFESGTTLSVGVKEVMTDSNDKNTGIDLSSLGGSYIPLTYESPALHKPVIYFAVQQELLNNAFGMNDRKMKRILKNQTAMTRSALLYQLSGLVVSTLGDYWGVTVNKAALENAQKEYNSTVRVRNIIARNLRVGLAESYELNQYNALVASSKMKVENTKQLLAQSVRNLVRTINLPPETKVEGVTNLITYPVQVDVEKSIEKAYEKRIDYVNLQKELEIALMQKDIAKNESWPSLKASLSVRGTGYDEKFGSAFGEMFNGKYPVVDVGLRLTYPLWDLEVKNSLRNADYRVKQLRIQVEDKKKEIRNDVISKAELLQVRYNSYVQSQEVLKQSELYYKRLLDRSRKGKISAVVLKSAIDSVTNARQNELQSLVRYNVAILQYDLALNQIFEKYHVDVDKIIAEADQSSKKQNKKKAKTDRETKATKETKTTKENKNK